MNEGRVSQEWTVEQSHSINKYTERYNETEWKLMTTVPVKTERWKNENVVKST